MNTVPSQADNPGDPDPAALPPPARRAELSAFAGLLFDLYGPDRSAWPHPDAWPWERLPGARAA
jgi:hypothetical protein